mgnify:CR=1 FL=1
MSMSYRVVRLAPSSRVSLSIVMAWAGQMASQSLQATCVHGGKRLGPASRLAWDDEPMHRSSPVAYRRRACSPRNRGLTGPFSATRKHVRISSSPELSEAASRTKRVHDGVWWTASGAVSGELGRSSQAAEAHRKN